LISIGLTGFPRSAIKAPLTGRLGHCFWKRVAYETQEVSQAQLTSLRAAAGELVSVVQAFVDEQRADRAGAGLSKSGEPYRLDLRRPR
jgi:hypothetical protein